MGKTSQALREVAEAELPVVEETNTPDGMTTIDLDALGTDLKSPPADQALTEPPPQSPPAPTDAKPDSSPTQQAEASSPESKVEQAISPDLEALIKEIATSPDDERHIRANLALAGGDPYRAALSIIPIKRQLEQERTRLQRQAQREEAPKTEPIAMLRPDVEAGWIAHYYGQLSQAYPTLPEQTLTKMAEMEAQKHATRLQVRQTSQAQDTQRQQSSDQTAQLMAVENRWRRLSALDKDANFDVDRFFGSIEGECEYPEAQALVEKYGQHIAVDPKTFIALFKAEYGNGHARTSPTLQPITTTSDRESQELEHALRVAGQGGISGRTPAAARTAPVAGESAADMALRQTWDEAESALKRGLGVKNFEEFKAQMNGGNGATR